MSTLADYDLIEVIGEGASGVVYRARHRALDRPVAIKILRGGAMDAADQARFRQEARLAASLDHPHIVPLYEVGEDQGRFFLVMKLIEGTDLKKSAEWMRPYPRKVAQVMASVARAVQHAHERGVLHRDLKATNILIDTDGQPHLIDFGLARPLEGGAALTTTSVIVGTPAYLSPEQAVGNRQLGPATDVWSLGVILHELLTGRLPFEGSTTYAVLLAIQNGSVALERRAATDLERICLRCLRRDPAERYPSAAALAEDLERVSEGERLNRTWRDRGMATLRRWGPRAAAAVVALLLLAIVLPPVLARWRFSREQEQQQEALAGLAVYLDGTDPEARAEMTDADLADLRKYGRLHLSVFARAKSRRGVRIIDEDNALTHDEQITSLDLSGTQITHVGLKHLAGLKKLNYLGLDGRQVTDAVLAVLQQNGQLRALAGAEGKPAPFTTRDRIASASDDEIVSLKLQDTAITDAGLKHLAGLTNLENLDLIGTKVTHEGLKHLAGLKKLAHLRLKLSQLTSEMVGVLHQNGQSHALAIATMNGGSRWLNSWANDWSFQLSQFERPEQFTEAGLTILSVLRHLGILDLSGFPITDEGLKHLAGLRRLNNLSLRGTQVSDDGMQHLAGLPSLQTLDLSNTKVTDAGLRHLAGLKNLESLDLFGTKVSHEGLKHLAGLKKLKQLRLPAPITGRMLEVLQQNGQVHLGWAQERSRISEAGLKYLAEVGPKYLAGLKGVWNLDLSNIPIPDDGLKQLTGLKDLDSLSLRGTRITDAGMQHLAKFLYLESLDLRGLPITDGGVKHLAGLKYLKTLDLSNTKVTHAGLKHLAGLKKLEQLRLALSQVNDETAGLLQQNGRSQTLILSSANWGDVRLSATRLDSRLERPDQFAEKELKFLSLLKDLRDLDLGGLPLTNDGLRHIDGLTQLDTLSLSGTRITDAGLKHIAALPNLKCLVLRDLPITDVGMKHLAGLIKLESLYLSGTKVTPAGLKHLAGLKKLNQLQLPGPVTDEVVEVLRENGQLHLGWPQEKAQITDASLKYLAGLKNLESLDLSNQTITDAGLKHLAEAKSLRWLNLSGTKVTHEGLKHLAGLKKLNDLKMDYERITDEVLEVLQQNGQLRLLEFVSGVGNNRPLSNDDEIRSLGLGVSETDDPDKGVKKLSGVVHVTDKGVKHLSGLKSLRNLQLGCPRITDEGMKHLVGQQNLEHLDLIGTKVTHAGLKHLAGLEKLKHLSVRPVTDAVLEVLHRNGQLHILAQARVIGDQQAYNDAGITCLLLHHRSGEVRVTDRGLKYLAGLDNLRRLELEGLQISDYGLKHLAGLWSLEFLTLDGTQISDAGLKHLAGLKGLKSLHLRNTKITSAGLRQLKAGLPGCSLDIGP